MRKGGEWDETPVRNYLFLDPDCSETWKYIFLKDFVSFSFLSSFQNRTFKTILNLLVCILKIIVFFFSFRCKGRWEGVLEKMFCFIYWLFPYLDIALRTLKTIMCALWYKPKSISFCESSITFLFSKLPFINLTLHFYATAKLDINNFQPMHVFLFVSCNSVLCTLYGVTVTLTKL